MIQTLTLLRQLIFYLPKSKFGVHVKKFEANRYVKSFDTWSHFLVLLTAQIKGWESLREIENGFNSRSSLTYHLGIRALPKRSNLSKANNQRDYRVYEATFYSLLNQVKERLSENKLKVKKDVNLFDSTVITVSLELFQWATYRRSGGFKIHTSFNLNTRTPTYSKVTHGNVNDVEGFNDDIEYYRDSIIVFDKGYFSFDLFRNLNNQNTMFVTRIKRDTKYKVLSRRDTSKNVCEDAIIRMTGSKGKRKYQDNLRIVKFIDEETKKELTFLTNNFKYKASTVAYLYKKRWEIELFFKWIKQNLRIKKYLGTSENAVKTQVWVALVTYLLLYYVSNQCNYQGGMLKFTRTVKEMLFEDIGLLDLMSDKFISQHKRTRLRDPSQLVLH